MYSLYLFLFSLLESIESEPRCLKRKHKISLSQISLDLGLYLGVEIIQKWMLCLVLNLQNKINVGEKYYKCSYLIILSNKMTQYSCYNLLYF